MNHPPVTTAAVGNSQVRWEIEATIIRADGTIEPLGVIGSTKWSWLSPARLRAWLLIKRANWRNWRRITEA